MTTQINFEVDNVAQFIVAELIGLGFELVEYDDDQVDQKCLQKDVIFDHASFPARLEELRTNPGDTYQVELAQTGKLHVINRHGEFETMSSGKLDFWEVLQCVGLQTYHGELPPGMVN